MTEIADGVMPDDVDRKMRDVGCDRRIDLEPHALARSACTDGTICGRANVSASGRQFNGTGSARCDDDPDVVSYCHFY